MATVGRVVVGGGSRRHDEGDSPAQARVAQAAFECMYTLVPMCRERADLLHFMERLVAGLHDKPDICELCHVTLIRSAHLASSVVVQSKRPSDASPRRRSTDVERDTHGPCWRERHRAG